MHELANIVAYKAMLYAFGHTHTHTHIHTHKHTDTHTSRHNFKYGKTNLIIIRILQKERSTKKREVNKHNPLQSTRHLTMTLCNIYQNNKI